eukprot:COSAG02_NODE_46218_length_350_cov_3.625498_1_plen_76_part_01
MLSDLGEQVGIGSWLGYGFQMFVFVRAICFCPLATLNIARAPHQKWNSAEKCPDSVEVCMDAPGCRNHAAMLFRVP